MKDEIGLWIDQKKTVIIDGSGQDTIIINSNLEIDEADTGAKNYPAEDQHDRRVTGHMKKYYMEVIAHLKGAKNIMILGPGEAKLELQKRLAAAGLENKIVKVENADKLTNRQLAAKVRAFFATQKQAAY